MDFAGVANPDGRRCSGQQRFVVDAHSATGILLTAPALVLLSATVLYPIAVTFWLSIHGKDFAVTHRGPLVGFDNYVRVFAHPIFERARQHRRLRDRSDNPRGRDRVAGRPALDRGLRGRDLQAVIALPLMVAPVVGALAWRWMFAYAYGVINGSQPRSVEGSTLVLERLASAGHHRDHQSMARAALRHPHAGRRPRQPAAEPLEAARIDGALVADPPPRHPADPQARRRDHPDNPFRRRLPHLRVV